MKIAVAREILPNQFRSNDFSIPFDQTAIGLIGEEKAGGARQREWIGEPGQRRHQNGQYDCRT
jgi:hypothetical protein